jgi:PmbA protein
VNIQEHKSDVHLVDSHGEHIHHQSTMYSASATCKAEAGGDSQMGGDYGFSTTLEGLDIGSVSLASARYATELLGAGQAPTMKCPAVLRNSVMAELVEFLSSSFSAEEIDKGRSMLAGKQGQRIFSEQLKLIDDGLMPGGYGTAPFDGEGVPSRRKVLIDNGFVSGTLVDGYYGRKLGLEPTGNSGRGIKSPPSIDTTNLYIPAGPKTLEKLFDGISKGLLVTDLMGVHTANPVTGDFSLGASGILIENGKLTRPVRGFAVAGNVLEVFRRIVDTGNDLKFFGGVGAPSARVSEISVGGA